MLVAVLIQRCSLRGGRVVTVGHRQHPIASASETPGLGLSHGALRVGLVVRNFKVNLKPESLAR